MRPKPMNLLDLDENLIVSICKLPSVREKLQLRLVSRGFQNLLDDPEPGCGIWGVVSLEDFTLDNPLPPLYRRNPRGLCAHAR